MPTKHGGFPKLYDVLVTTALQSSNRNLLEVTAFLGTALDPASRPPQRPSCCPTSPTRQRPRRRAHEVILCSLRSLSSLAPQVGRSLQTQGQVSPSASWA